MKKALFLLTLLYSTLSIGQTFNKRIIDTSQVAAMDFSNLLIKEDTIITIGRGAINVSPYPTKLMLSKFSMDGEQEDILLEVDDSITNYVAYYGISYDKQDDTMIIVGGAGDYWGDDLGFVAKIKDESTIDWLYTYEPYISAYSYRFSTCKILSNNTILVAGILQPNYNSAIRISILVCMNELGEVLWEQHFTNLETKYLLTSLYEDSDTTLLAGFEVTENVSDPALRTHRSTIYRINHEGEVLAEWQNDNDSTYAPRKILRTPDGGFVFVGRALKGYTDDFYPFWEGYICKLNSELEKEWELKLAESSYYTTFYSMVQTADGNFIATGNSLKYLEDGLQKQHGWLVKFNEEGDIIWERKILSGSEWYSQITDIAELPDGGLVACGLSQAENEDYPQRGWLLRMDEYGCFDGEPCDTIVSVGDFTIIPQPLVEVMPNPAHDYFEVQTSDQQPLEHIIIYSALGQQVWSATNIKQQKIEVPCQNWPRGTYFVNVNNQWSGRVVLSD